MKLVKNMNKTICIDARLWGTRHTGIGRYIENLIAHLPNQDKVRVVLIVPPDLKQEPLLKNFPKVYASSHPYSIWSQFEMLLILLKVRPDLLHVPHFTIPVFWPGKIIVTIHDLIKHISTGADTTTHSKSFYKIKFLGYLLIVRLAINKASHIIVPANYWKNDLLRRYKISSEKISVIYEGVNSGFFESEKTGIQADGIKTPYVIYAGNLYPHKNIPILLQAVKSLSGSVNLALVCARSVFSERIESMVSQLHMKSMVYFLGFVSDSRLASLYRNSQAFITPSLIEGFGLPGLEAMAAGTPVIAADSSCLPEIYGKAALYFDPNNPGQLADIIKKIIFNEKLRQDLVRMGKTQVAKYSWSKMSQATWQIYQNALP